MTYQWVEMTQTCYITDNQVREMKPLWDDQINGKICAFPVPSQQAGIAKSYAQFESNIFTCSE